VTGASLCFHYSRPMGGTTCGTSSTKFKGWGRATEGRAAIALIGDDDGTDRGPAGWPIAGRAVAWARWFVVHATGAEIVHYEAAIVAAQRTGRVLFVECGSATLEAWSSLVHEASRRPAGVVIRTPDGGRRDMH
jgi:hypothetical protein